MKYLPVAHQGLIDVDTLNESISKNTFLLTFMYANNEIGTIEPIEEIGKIAHEHEITLHTDAVQAVTKIPIDVKKQHIDMLALSSHKIYGPKGIGALYIRNGIKIHPIIHGGGQEKGSSVAVPSTPPGLSVLGKPVNLPKKE